MYIYLIYIHIYITNSNLDITDMERTLLLRDLKFYWIQIWK